MKNETILQTLKERMLQLVPKPGFHLTAIDGLGLARREADARVDCIGDPLIAIIVQGHKRVLIADVEYHYKEGQFIARGMDLPSINEIIDATPKTPLLALSIPLDRYIFFQLAADIPPAPLPNANAYKGVTVADAETELLDAFLRLLNLLKTPERIPVLAPMLIREIHYYLLIGQKGEDFRLLGSAETYNNQIAHAVSWLRDHYHEQFSLADIVAQVNMSQSSFCRHFRRITGMTPIQFQKRLRLYEAQRLMLTENTSAETAAFTVGYESPTQFNREYKRQFGEPPHRDIERLLKAKTALDVEP